MNKNTVFHYTNLEAFKKIIVNKELWFTRIDCLNDYSEYNYYEKILIKARKQFIQEKSYKLESTEKLISTHMDKLFVDIRKKYYKKTFAFSLTAYSGTSGRRFRKHPDTKPEVSGHFAG